jgi:tetratricopeptide (TPR) repeat protein
MRDATFLTDPEPDWEPEDKKSNAFRNVAIALSVIGGVLALSCCGFGAIVYFAAREQFQKIQQAFVDQPVILPAPEIETLEQRLADIRAGFGAVQPDADAATTAAVSAFFDKLVESTRGKNEPQFRSLIDGARFMGEVKKRGILKQLTQSGEIGLIADFQNRWISIPAYWQKCRVANVRPNPDGRDAVAYVYLWDESQAISEVRFWITRSGGQWKAYDWEQLEFGARGSFEGAVYTRDAVEPRTKDHLQAQAEMTEACNRYSNGDQQAAAELLARAERRTAIPELADNQSVRLAYAWRYIGRPRNCLAALQKVRAPAIAAGTLRVQAALNQQYGLHRRALDFARQCEAAVGGGPACDEQLAQILDSLGQVQEAIACRQKLLRFDPDNAQALAALAVAVDVSNSQLVVDMIQNTTEPVERAQGLVAYVASNGDPAVAQALADIVVQAGPDSARAAAVQAQLAVALGDHDRGAAFYKTAIGLTENDKSRASYMTGYLDAMSAAGKLLEGYEQAPDAIAAFRHLAGAGDDDQRSIAPDKLKSLCQAHREKFPDDPWLHYHTGMLLEQEQNLEGAEREMHAAVAGASEYDAGALRDALFSFLDRTGKCREAYDSGLPVREAFQRLVQSHDWSHSSCDLGEIHQRHAAAHPDDPWLDACAAIIQRDSGNKHEALRLGTHGYEAAQEESIKQHYRWLVSGLAIDVGDFGAVYKVASNSDEALRTLWQQTYQRHSPQQRQAILDQHRQSQPLTALWRMLQAEQQWNDHDYAAVVSTIEPDAAAMLSELPDWDAGRFGDWYVRSLVQCGRAEAARTFAKLICDQCGKALPLLYIHARDHNLSEIERLLGEFGNDTWKISAVYNDSEIGAVLRSADSLALRRAFPPELPASIARSSVVFLLDEPPLRIADIVQSATSDIWGNNKTVEPLATPLGMPSPQLVESWLVRAGAVRIIVTAGGERRFADAGTGVRRPQSETLADALERHRGWLSVRWLGSDRNQPAERSVDSPVYRLAARLRNDHCLAVELSPSNIFVVNSPEVGIKLEAEDPQTELAGLGETFWLPRQDAFEFEVSNQQDMAFSRSLAKLDARFKNQSPDESFEIGILVRDDDVAEVLKLELDHVSRALYRGRMLRGTLKTNSHLWPELAAGEPLSVFEHQLVEWSSMTGESIERTARW